MTAIPLGAEEAIARRSLWIDAWGRLRRNRAAIAALAILLAVALMALFGPLLSPNSYDDILWDKIRQPPDWSAGLYFGTDENGRDLFVRTLYGARISLMVGLVATLVALAVGVSYGAVAGYLGGAADAVMMRLVDVLYSVPFIFLVILLMVLFGRNIVLIFAAIGAVEWLDMARIVRGQTLSLRRSEFVEAARALGLSNATMIRRHIVPNILGPVIVYATLLVPRVILVESLLSFLGLGVQEPMTSWGVLISDGARNIEAAPYLLVFPATFLAVTLFSFNFLGDGLRDALDPKDR